MHILSNIGEKTFAQLRTLYPDIFSYFDGIRIVTAQDNYISKPDPAMFHDYQTTLNHDNKHVVFIDDKRKNIAAAADLGITAIRYKSGDQLREALQELALL